MPNKNRTIYQQQSLLVGPTPCTGVHFTGADNYITGLYRLQSCNYSVNVNRTPVNQFGELAAIDRVILETPTVGLSFGYLLANFWNERALGFVTDGTLPALSGILNKSQDDKNYFLKVVAEGRDAVGDTENTDDVSVVGFGNAYLTSYSTQAAINSFPTVDVAVEALNLTFQTGTIGPIPAINHENGLRITNRQYVIPTVLSSPGTGLLDVSVLRPGDITIEVKQRSATDEGILENATDPYDTLGVNLTTAKIQSYNLSFGLSRESIQKLGTRYATSREITFPIDVNLSMDALVGDLTTGSWSDIIDCDKAYDITINLKKPVCPGDPQPVMARYVLKNAKTNSHSYSQGIGDNKTVSIEFGAQIGGPNQTTIGLWMSGVTDVQ